MKTLKELNSKWYWRLFKVIYLGLISIMVLIIGVISSEIFYQHSPDDVSFVKNKLEEQYHAFIERQKRIDDLLGDYSSGNLSKISINKAVQVIYIMQILAQDENANVEGVYGLCEEFDFRCFPYFFPESGPYESYLQDGIEIGISRNELNRFRLLLDDIKLYNKNKNDYSQYDYFESYKNIVDKNYYIPYPDYLGFTGVIKSIGIGLVALSGAAAITLILKLILYYIIFGKFNPEK